MIIEATAVEAIGRITPGCLGLYSDANERALADVLASVRRYSPVPVAIQLAHAGRKGSSEVPWRGGALIAAAARRLAAGGAIGRCHTPTAKPPRWRSTRQGWRACARRSSMPRSCAAARDSMPSSCTRRTATCCIEFLSPIANRRSDAYGGSLAARMRFPLEVFDAVRAAVPASMPVGVRLSAIDWVDDGWDLEQSVAYGRALRERGCSYLHVSSGGVSPLQKIAAGARAIRCRSRSACAKRWACRRSQWA